MTVLRPDLIYDVGLLDGSDTEYYLFRGYKVVAIDANPLMIENARERFATELADGRLTLLNSGIAETSGLATFWVSEHPPWSSFQENIASRDGVACRPISVAVRPFSAILAEYGVPYYMKIDIEGNDRLCLEALRGTRLPEYLSVEAECVGDGERLSEEAAIAMLILLRKIGYTQFKLVNQEGWASVRPDGLKRFCMGLVNGAAGRPPEWLARFAEKRTDRAHLARLGFRFTKDSSGPWGDDVPGGWMTFEPARSAYLRERREFFSVERPLYSFWYDWHATY